MLHVKGATSFAALRSYDDVVHVTFKAAASSRGLLESDEEWDRCLREAAVYEMPRQLRDTFAFICIFCQPSSAIDLWNKYVNYMALDYMRTDSNDCAINKALHDIDALLKQHGSSCLQLGLPIPTGSSPAVPQQYDVATEARKGADQISMLNENQSEAFNKIIAAVEDEHIQQRCFYVDGPGGSGKTFLYTTLMAFVRGKQLLRPSLVYC